MRIDEKGLQDLLVSFDGRKLDEAQSSFKSFSLNFYTKNVIPTYHSDITIDATLMQDHYNVYYKRKGSSFSAYIYYNLLKTMQQEQFEFLRYRFINDAWYVFNKLPLFTSVTNSDPAIQQVGFFIEHVASKSWKEFIAAYESGVSEYRHSKIAQVVPHVAWYGLSHQMTVMPFDFTGYTPSQKPDDYNAHSPWFVVSQRRSKADEIVFSLSLTWSHASSLPSEMGRFLEQFKRNMFEIPEQQRLTRYFSKSVIQIIKDFSKMTYPELVLTPQMLAQISWLQNNSVVTSQSSLVAQKTSVNDEVMRILSRLNALRLLEAGGLESYQALTQSQPVESKLTEAQFDALSSFIKQLSEPARQALKATCCITKSDMARAAVPEARRHELPADSEYFITYLTTHFSSYLPIIADLSEEAIVLLPYAFYQNAHARQMLDMEGGYQMIASIRAGILNGELTKERFDLWFARWIINIAGMDGHVETKGSTYLTRPVAACIDTMKHELDKLPDSPDHLVIAHYLQFRADQLKPLAEGQAGLTLEEDAGRYIAYCAALMRRYEPEIGAEIQAWFEGLSAEEQSARIASFKAKLEHTRVTPTYMPPLLQNLVRFGCSISEALTLFTQIELKANHMYHHAIQSRAMSPDTPLCYRDLGFKEFLPGLVAHFREHGVCPDFNINSSGLLSIVESEKKVLAEVKAMPDIRNRFTDILRISNTAVLQQSTSSEAGQGKTLMLIGMNG
jgi:chloramphenicol O-acetyltransferase